MQRVTCYKLCYLLGVPNSKLASDFIIEHRLARRDGNFPITECMLRVRALSGIFFLVMKYYSSCAEMRSFSSLVAKEYSETTAETSYDPIKERGSLKLADYLRSVVEEHNALLPQVWQDANIALTEEQLALLLRLPEISDKTLPSLQFLHSNTDHMYGMYFYGRELLSVSLGSMLRDDLALRDRLSIYYATRLDSLYDRTKFAKAVTDYTREVFATPAVVSRRWKIYALLNPDGTKPAKTVDFFSDYVVEWVTLEDLDLSSLDFRSCIVSSDCKLIADKSRDYPNVMFGVVLPIESRYYNRWRRRKHENIVLIGR